MFDSLLVPVDDSPESERVVVVAAAVAAIGHAAIEFITVDSPHVDVAPMSAYQQRLVEALPTGIAGRGTVVLGAAPVADLLVDAYRARPTALLALATRAPGTLWQWLGGGSVGDDVVHEALRPVLLVGPRGDAVAAAATLDEHTTAALDGTEVDDQVVAAAVDWCRLAGTPLTLLRAVTNPAEPDAHRDAAADLELRVGEARNQGVDAHARVVDAGDPGRAVLHHVSASRGTLIVGSHRRGPLGRIVRGSNALWLVHKSPVPVLVAGFEVASIPASEAASGDLDLADEHLAAIAPSTAAELLGWSDLGTFAV